MCMIIISVLYIHPGKHHKSSLREHLYFLFTFIQLCFEYFVVFDLMMDKL